MYRDRYNAASNRTWPKWSNRCYTHTHTHTDIDRDNAGSEMEPLMEARRLLMNRVSPGLAEKQCGDSYD